MSALTTLATTGKPIFLAIFTASAAVCAISSFETGMPYALSSFFEATSSSAAAPLALLSAFSSTARAEAFELDTMSGTSLRREEYSMSDLIAPTARSRPCMTAMFGSDLRKALVNSVNPIDIALM